MSTQEKRKCVYQLSPWQQMLSDLIEEIWNTEGKGKFNAHAHLDRANTLRPEHWIHSGYDPFAATTFPLKVKQTLIGELHKGLAYTEADLRSRMEDQLKRMIANGTTRVDSLLDATTDIGLIAFEVAAKLREQYKDQIDFRFGPQPIFGFKQPGSDRLKIYRQAAKLGHFLGALPEKDDAADRMGFRQHIRVTLEEAIRLGKEYHVHIDQGNIPTEQETEILLDVIETIGSPVVKGSKQPTVWLIHGTSTACLPEKAWKNRLDRLKKNNVGINTCPRAAVTTRQIRSLNAPLHNSYIRLLDVVDWEISVRVGTDNIGDIFIATGSSDILDELVIMADALRYPQLKLLAKLACGVTPNDMDRANIALAREQDHLVFSSYKKGFPKITKG